MIAILGYTTAVLLGLALLFAALVGITLVLASDRGRALLRRFAWFRRFELLPAPELRFRGLTAVGFGVCCFAALLTLELIDDVPLWPALTFGVLAVVAVTLGAALLERAAHLDD